MLEQKATERALCGGRTQDVYHIYVTNPEMFRVTRNGKLVDNWQILQPYARYEVESLVRERWTQHWTEIAQMAAAALKPDATLETLMPVNCIVAPSDVYPCPQWLAEAAEVYDGGQ